jgi:hypothetical protein
MNLVKLITDQISSDTLAKLSTKLGVDSETLESAITAAVPSMLAGLGGLAAKEDGIRKLSTSLGSLDDTMFGNFDRLLSVDGGSQGDSGTLLQKGSGLLQGLFGDGLTSSLATAVSRFTGLDASIVKTLLAYLTPVVLGRVASQWQNQGGTPGALKNLFADQKRNIEDALPSGFELADVAGLAPMGGVHRAATSAAASAPDASKSLLATVLPLALVLGGAFLLWNYWSNRQPPQEVAVKPALDEAEAVIAMKPIAPEAGVALTAPAVGQQLTEMLQSLGTTLADIQGGASADAALPKLEQLNRQLNTLSPAFESLPEAARTGLRATVNEQFAAVNTQAERVTSLPGMGQRVIAIVNEIVRKLGEMHAAIAGA